MRRKLEGRGTERIEISDSPGRGWRLSLAVSARLPLHSLAKAMQKSLSPSPTGAKKVTPDHLATLNTFGSGHC